MANKILLNGVDYTKDCLEIENIESITYTLDETTRTVSRSITSDFTFRGNAYTYLTDIFFSDVVDGCDETVDVQIVIDFCKDVDLFYTIVANSVTYCPNKCEVRVTLTKLDTDNQMFNCLNRTRVLDNDAVNNIRLPHLEYCTGEGFRGAGAILFTIINTIFNIINVIIFAINLIPGINIPLLGAELIDGLLGCDRQAPGFHVKDMFVYQTGQCGGVFQSTSIYDLANYSNTVVIPMAYKDGENDCPNIALLLENRPNRTLISFMQSLANFYDADFRVRGGALMFETKEYFDTTLTDIGDVEEMEFESLESLCYEYDLDEQYASYGRFDYSYDANDTYGNRVAPLYNDIIEWNPSGLDSRKGEYANTLTEFSPLYIIGMEQLNTQTPIAQLIGHGVISGGQSSFWKIYTWDGANLCKSRAVQPPPSIGSNLNWNYPYMFQENSTPQNGLYDEFHSHKDPNIRPCPMRVPDFSFLYPNCCDLIETLETVGTDITMTCPYGRITPSEVTVSLLDGSFTFSGNRIIKD